MPALQWISLAVVVLVGAMLIGVTVTGRDLWPFSGYPMFSAYRSGAASQRFFGVYFHFGDGRALPPPGGCAARLEAFQRDFGRAWAAGGSDCEAMHAVVNELWTQAAAVEPMLDEATHVEVRVTLAQLGAPGGLRLAEKSLGRFARAGRG